MQTASQTRTNEGFRPTHLSGHTSHGEARAAGLGVEASTPEGWVTGRLEPAEGPPCLADFSKPELRRQLRQSVLDLRRAQIALRQTARADRDRRWLMATAGHDLRQPLQVMMLALESLTRRPERAAWISEVLRGEVCRLREGLDQLAAAAAAAPEDIAAPSLEAVQLADLFDTARARWTPIARAKGLNLRIVPSDLAVLSDPVLLTSITDNLVGNAIKYTERGSVLLGCRRAEAAVRLEVIDTGIGFDPKDLASLMQPFRQGDANSEGLGLGLSLVLRATRRLGHQLAARSSPGRGAHFVVTAPQA
jgi:signal transduction histidine kinase